VSGVSNFYPAFGVYNVSGLQIVAQPDSEQNLIILSEAVDLSILMNQEYLSEQFGVEYLSSYEIAVRLLLRPCISGEGLRDNGACYTCPTGTYLLEPPTEPTECKFCPSEKAYCNGGSDIGPKPGYWRKDNETDNFIVCFVAAACLGMYASDSNETSPVGFCAEGYYGALCTSCMPGYNRSGDYGCSLCPKSVQNILRITGIIILMSFIVVFMVRSTLASALKKNIHSVYIKIFMNHMQMLLITASFDLDWPSQVKVLLESNAPVSQSSESIFSFDCFMNSGSSSDVDRYNFVAPEGQWRIVYQKMLMQALFPPLLAVVTLSVWAIILKRQKHMEYLHTRFISTLVIVLFLVHP